MVSVKEITKKQAWEDFVLASANPSFLQSWAWGDFQGALGRGIFRLGVYDNDSLVGVSLLTHQKSKLTSFFYCPAGPIFLKFKKEFVEGWLTKVKSLARNAKASFLRIDPRVLPEDQKETYLHFGFREAPEYTQPPATAVIDLSKDEQGLLAGMGSSTRYNIGASQRKGVSVRDARDEEINIFVDLLNETAARKDFVLPIEADYHKKQFEVLHKAGIMKLFIAEHDKETLAATLAVFYGKGAFYLHSATANKKKDLRASYPLVWRVIQEAKRVGKAWLDFWGVAENDDPAHPWAGVTAFKLSFGAEKKYFAPPLDLPFRADYQLSRFVETYRKKVRSLLRFGG